MQSKEPIHSTWAKWKWMISEMARWLMVAGAVLVAVGVIAFAFSDDPA
jgi:hypothetical protein